MTAIVGNCYFNGLTIIQELGRRDVDVYAVDSFPNVGTVSRYGQYRRCPSPKHDEDGFVEGLLEIATALDHRPVVIPTSDLWASALAANRGRLEEACRLCVADQETVELFLDKQAFGEWASDRGYASPRTWSSDTVLEAPDSAYPLAAKPGDALQARENGGSLLKSALEGTVTGRLRQNGTDPPGASEVRLQVLEDRAAVEQFLDNHERREFVFQEYVAGASDSMYTVGIYANDGEVKALFSGRKLRGYPADVGDCKVGQIQSVPSELEQIVVDICAARSYTGIAEFEFKRDVTSGTFSLIEINPRSWSWVGITPACGVSIPWIAYADLVEGEALEVQETPVTPTATDGSVTWVNVLEDLPNCLYWYQRTYPEWACGPREWWESVSADRVVAPDLSLDDPLPTGYAVALLGRRVAIHALEPIPKYARSWSTD